MDKLVFFLIILKDAAISVGKWIETHSNFISSAATVVIAAFTLTLWWTTRKLWKASLNSLSIAQQAANAADASAKALPIMERAYVFSNIKLDREIKIGDKEFYAMLYLINHGHTPAIIKDIAFKGDISNDCPTTKNLSNPHYPLESFIGSSKDSYEDRWHFHITKEQWGELITINSNIKLYCIGYVKYITIFGQEHCHGFCWEFDASSGKFALSPKTELNYNT